MKYSKNDIKSPGKSEQKIAKASFPALSNVILQLRKDNVVIEIEENGERIRIPVRALVLLRDILEAMSQGKPVSIVPQATEVTTQGAAEMLGCSRPHVIKLLEEGQIAYTKVGKHRRIQFEDVVSYKQKMKEEQKQHLIDIMHTDEESGLYDS
ncbi:protein containing DNA binding domain, excisionase family [Bacteroidales bacterium 6E]|nr:protein containing DNA binding domain, excisionase family [Bacteroidales bacterium 6E]